MHACLLVADVFHNILEFVALIPPDQDNAWRGYNNRYTTNPFLAALARTCRTFSEPSLDVLWRSQFTLGPLIRTLPPHVCSEEIEDASALQPGCVTHHLTLKPPIARSDWDRFDYYAAKVKSLGYYMFEFADQDLTNWLHHHFLHFSRPVTRQTMELLCLCRRRPFILPNLRRLRLTCGDIQLLRFIPMMLGPNLQALSIAFYAGNILLDPTISNELYHSVLRKLLESLPSLCPSLTELAICTEQLPDVANAALSFAYKSKHLLGCFIAYIPTWPREVLLHLSQQEHLRDIYLSLDEDTANLTWLQSVRYPFPSLDTLDMRCPSLKSCATLIKLMGACTLRLLKFEAAEGPPPTTDLQELFVALRTHCSVSTLQSLLVEYYADRSKDGGRTETSQEEHSFTGELVSPMYAFSQLRFFRLHTPFVSFLNDQDLRDMADHWPLLIELRLADDWEWFAGPFDTTWAGLAYVAWKCPQLIEVAIAMDMRADNVTETTSQEGFRPNRHLRHINCLDSVMCDVEMCARSVHAFAPLVWEIWGHGWGEWDEDHASKRPPDQDPIGFYETATSMIQETHASEEFAVAAKHDPLEDMNPWSALATTRPKPTRTWIQ